MISDKDLERRGTVDRSGRGAFLAGMASILDGMASMFSWMSPPPRRRYTTRSKDVMDALNRDAGRVRGWNDLPSWYGPASPERPWPHPLPGKPKK